MKVIARLIVFFGVIVSLVSFVNPDKKLEKIAAKLWPDQEIQLRQMNLPDSLKSEVGELYEVSANNTVLGYACYATAFGCRVGGCAAPSNPNVQSYETFDYIVVYDEELKIKKVDIANYGGQYGYEICRAKWLKQFENQTTGFVLNENIDGISGATVSAQFLVDDLNAVGTVLKSIDLSSLSASVN